MGTCTMFRLVTAFNVCRVNLLLMILFGAYVVCAVYSHPL